MGEISTLFVHKVSAMVEDDAERRDLVRQAGVDPDAPMNPKLMIPDQVYYDFFESVARVNGMGPDLPLRVGATMHTDEYGAFGLAWKSAPTLRDSCARAERYGRVLTSVSTYSLKADGDAAFFHLHRDGERRLGMRLSNEATMASIQAISSQVSTLDFRPTAVFLKHPRPDNTDVHEQHFRCPVHFDSDRDALLLSNELLDAPNKLGDPGTVSFFDTHLDDEIAEFRDEEKLDVQLRPVVKRALSQGVPRISDVAASLGMSGRTLQRRLAGDGLSFQQLVDDARRELASKLLEDTGYPLAQVAFLTGFSEQSAFNRAFKRWAGQTPRSYRISVQEGAQA